MVRNIKTIMTSTTNTVESVPPVEGGGGGGGGGAGVDATNCREHCSDPSAKCAESSCVTGEDVQKFFLWFTSAE